MQAFNHDNESHVEALQKLLMRRASAARDSFPAFVEFVMREQLTKRRIRLAPHQRVVCDFWLTHPRTVVWLPAGASKTFLEVGFLLWNLGRDVTQRWLVGSATQEQAAKLVEVAKDYLERSHELRLVFPHLRPMRGHWTGDSITVERPGGIPDPSITAVGGDTQRIMGSRLSGAIIDDLLNDQNTATKDAREKLLTFIDPKILSRLDPSARVLVTNTAWHPEDPMHHLAAPAKGGWPWLKMRITGDIEIGDDPHRMKRGLEPWDHDLLRPKYRRGSEYTCRLVRPGLDDSKNDVPLFPERFMFAPWKDPDTGEELAAVKTLAEAVERARLDIEHRRSTMSVIGFNQQFMCEARDDGTAMCKVEWVEKCKAAARAVEHFSMISKYTGRNATFTGVDLAIGLGEENDETAFFTFEVMANRQRRILDIEIGRWPGPIIIQKLIAKMRAYRSVARVENNGAQAYLRQQALWDDASLMIEAHTTGRAKAHPEHGVPGGFIEMSHGAWLIPNGRDGSVHPHVQKWIDGCLYYTPSKHTDDSVMAWYFAREQAARWGLLTPPPKKGASSGGGGFDPRRR